MPTKKNPRARDEDGKFVSTKAEEKPVEVKKTEVKEPSNIVKTRHGSTITSN